MQFHIRLLDEAVEDLAGGRDFYERQLSGLGDYFLDSIFSDIESLYLYAGIHPSQYGHYKMLARRFPYAIYYKFVDNVVEIRAILDCRRNPTDIEKRF